MSAAGGGRDARPDTDDSEQDGAAVPGVDMTASPLNYELARLAQGLSDLSLSGGSELMFLRCDGRGAETAFLQLATQLARKRGFVSAELSLKRWSFDELDEVVRHIVDSLVPPTANGTTTRRGLVSVVDVFTRKHGAESQQIFEANCSEFGASGDLTALTRGYLLARTAPDDALLELQAWLDGVKVEHAASEHAVRGALSPRNAGKALVELTRLVRALGFAGCFFCLCEGHTLVHRTASQRRRAYTVIRELIDNFDGGRGTLATRMLISGKASLFEGDTSLRSLEPLISRIGVLDATLPPPPHRPWATLTSATSTKRYRAGPREGAKVDSKALRAVIRSSQGLPPVEAIASLSVGYKGIDDVITQLLEHAESSGSVFTALTGGYGTGKTHLLLHLTERALAERHPVFRLSLERLNLDLGNPQRHLNRLLEHSVMPTRHRPSALERAASWTRSQTRQRALVSALQAIANSDHLAAPAATKALRFAGQARDRGAGLESYLCAHDLENKASSGSYRQDAYARFLLWIELLQRLDDCTGPVVLVDEAENLYAPGVSAAARRTALRSLAFYGGGVLPSACVVMAVTPEVWKLMKQESLELLEDLTEQSTTLAWEDTAMLRRRFRQLKPQPVPEFTRSHKILLAEKVRATHENVRGPVDDPEWGKIVRALHDDAATPREFVRSLIDRLEALWWLAQTGYNPSTQE